MTFEDLQQLDAKAKEFYYNDNFLNALLVYAEIYTKYPYTGLAYNNYGNILRELGLPEISYGFFETAMRIEPDSRIYGFNLAVAHLLCNDLEKGWELFEHRWRFKSHEDTLLSYTKPRWEGQDLKGKRLLVTCEEGDGDNIQFSRFTEHLTSLGAHVIHQTEPGLYRLFSNSFTNSTVITNKETTPEYDYWTPILSIPRVLKIHSYESMPYIFKYLTPNQTSINNGKKILGTKEKLRVGFCWRGQTKQYPFEKIIELIKRNPQFQWISFQVVCNADERNILNSLGVTDIRPYISDWEDTSGIMSHMDMMVTIDTGLCHIAGGLGIPCLLLLDRFKTCWRWLLDREDTVWYPSVRIVKQIENKNYDEQISRVNELLKQVV